MERVDGFLSRLIQTVLPTATTRVQDEHTGSEMWFIERGEHDQIIGIGHNFKEAKATLDCVIKAVTERRKLGVPDDKILQWGKR